MVNDAATYARANSVLRSVDRRTQRASGPAIVPTTPQELDRIVRRANDAFPPWESTGASARSVILDHVANAIERTTPRLARLADNETALGIPRLTGEVARTVAQIRMFSSALRDGSWVAAILSPEDIETRRPEVRRMLQPLGPVGVFAASNFPFAFSVCGGDTASALAAGCPVVVKAHDGHLATSLAVAQIVTDALSSAGAPDGVFGLVVGFAAGTQLVEHPAIRAVGFTGSLGGGRALFDVASRRPDPIPFYGELGSVNPVVVLPAAGHAAPADVAAGYLGSLTLGNGQFCTNPGLLFVPAQSSVLDEIAAAVTATTGGVMLTPDIRDGYRRHTESLDRHKNVRLLGHGTLRDEPDPATPRVYTTSLTDFTADLDWLSSECFGPAGLVVTYSDVDELLPALAKLPGSLAGAVHAAPQDVSAVAQVQQVLKYKVGRLIYNEWPTGVAVCWAMQHGGPWPASTNSSHTSVGVTAMNRWLRPVAYQSWPDQLLPSELRDSNPLEISRCVESAVPAASAPTKEN